MSVLNILNDIASDNGRKHKEAILTQFRECDLLKDSVKLALDPTINFYIRKIPEFQNKGNDMGLAWGIAQLGVLANRTLTGNAAINHLSYVLGELNYDDAEVLARIIAKDLRCGVSDATANKIWKGLIPEYPVMLASKFDEKLVKQITFPAEAQVKLDGMRVNVIVQNGNVATFTRNGKPVEVGDHFDAVFMLMANGKDLVFDGELLVLDNLGKYLDRKTGNGILNKAVKGTISASEISKIHVVLYDLIDYNDWKNEVSDVPYIERLQRLAESMALAESLGNHKHKVSLVKGKRVSGLAAAQEYFKELFALGEEGIILKDRNGKWENKRSKSLIKFKGEMEADLVCVGWEEGTGKNAGRLGALVVETRCGRLRSNVGTGFSDALREQIGKEVIGKIIAVKYNMRIQDKNSDLESLFLPVFVEVREDKTVADKLEDLA